MKTCRPCITGIRNNSCKCLKSVEVKKPAVQNKNGWCLKIVAANFKMKKTGKFFNKRAGLNIMI
jgi:hypothetical protein